MRGEGNAFEDRAFEVPPGVRLVYGAGSLERVGALVRDLPGTRVFLVTDPGIVAAGIAPRTVKLLEASGLEVVVFDRVRENPSGRDVEEATAAARGTGVDVLVGVGGGSSLDTAKGVNFLLTNGGCMEDYRGMGKALRPMLPMVAVPTTAGTGSECQSYALISHDVTHVKMACGDPKARPRVVILDPELTLSQPRPVTAACGMDALVHGLECLVTRGRNPASSLLAREALTLVGHNFKRVLAAPGDLQARGAMLLGASWAGQAIELSMLGAAHAAANGLTMRYGTVHGQAVGVMIPWVIRFNARDEETRWIYRDALRLLGPGTAASDPPLDAGEALARWVEQLLGAAGLARSLRELGVRDEDLSLLAAEAAQQWTGRHNPREVGEPGFLTLYRNAYQGPVRQ